MSETIASYHGYFLLAAGGVNLCIALLVSFSGVRSAMTYGFLHCTFGIVGYLILYGMMSLTSDMKLAMVLTHIGQVLINQISPGFYIFSVYFLNLERQKKWAKLSPFIGLLIIVLLFSIPGQTIRKFWWGNFNVYPLPQALPQLSLYYLLFFGFMVLSFRNFIVSYRAEKDPHRRLQIRHVFIAFVIAYIGSWDHLPINGIDVYPFGYIPLTAFSLIILYTIVKFRFLDIKFGIRRMALVGMIYAVLLVLVLPISIPLVRKLSSGQWSAANYGTLILGIAIGAVFSLGPFLYAILVRHNYWLKGHLTQGLTHELKSPLSIIQGSMDILVGELKNPRLNRQKSLDYAAMVQSNAARLEAFVKDLLNVAKIQEEQLAIEKSPTDLKQVVHDVITNYKSLAEKKGIIITIQAEELPTLHLDRSKIEQVVSNIFSNALKFSSMGIITIAVKRTGNEAACSIQDQGRGINPKNLTKIFDRFYQGSPDSKGSGIGLFIAKAWVEAHGGKIWAESEGAGKGTKMTFMVPA